MSIDLRSPETEPTLGHRFHFIPPAPRFRAFEARPHPPLQTVPTKGAFYDVAPNVVGLKTGISNVFMIGTPGTSSWVLIDAGMAGSASKIIDAAERRFGSRIAPMAIILTHGHFDHVGALPTLLDRWDVPVYAHPLELPYLTGKSSYPPPDPSVGGGAMAWISAVYPKKPINLGHDVHPLPAEGRVPQLQDWKWLPTPGHSPGHISLFRDSDQTLIAGDAFVTIRAESMMANLSLTPELHGPPAYFTPDWPAAHGSVMLLADLEPEVIATGHGIPLRGGNMRAELHQLASHFDKEALPKQGRYLAEPAVADRNGVLSVPPHKTRPAMTIMVLTGLLAMGGMMGFISGRLLPARRRPYSWRSLLMRNRGQRMFHMPSIRNRGHRMFHMPSMRSTRRRWF